jgi:hypothetical protein
MDKKLTKKLAAYSALAAGVVAAGTNAEAQIVYVDIDPDQTYTQDHDLDIDLNNDGIVDFTLLIGSGATRHAVRLGPEMGNEALGSGAGNFFYPFALNVNDPINDVQTVWNGTANGSLLTMAWVYTAGGSYGNWLNASDKYLGVRFFVGTDVHYGWIRFTITANAQGVTVVYKDYAYNTTPDQGLLAGQTVIGINEAASLDANIFTANNRLTVKLNQQTNGTISMINMLGQTVMSTAIAGTDMEIPLDGMDAGIYMVAVQTENGNFTRKVYVK